MAKRKRKSRRPADYLQALHTLESVLRDDTRQRIVETSLGKRNFREALRSLRSGLHSHRFQSGTTRVDLSQIVVDLDRQTRLEGVHVLHAWHHQRHEFLKESTPVLLLDYCAHTGIAPGFEDSAIAILLDYYFLNALALLACRAWDQGDASQNLRHITGLVHELQGSQGSGFRFVNDAEAVLLLAFSQYHPEEEVYGRLLEKVSTLEEDLKFVVAEVMAAMLGGHLRWGFQDLYRQDFPRLRQDNLIDYPWLLFSQWTLLQHYSWCQTGRQSPGDEKRIALGLLNGFTADPEILLGEPPEFLSPHRDTLFEFQRLFKKWKSPLLEQFERCQPVAKGFSPLSFRFNFPHNALVAMVITGLLRGVVWKRSLNDLLLGRPAGDSESVATLAGALTAFSSLPERRDTRGAVQVMYDPADGRRSFERTMECLRASS